MAELQDNNWGGGSVDPVTRSHSTRNDTSNPGEIGTDKLCSNDRDTSGLHSSDKIGDEQTDNKLRRTKSDRTELDAATSNMNTVKRTPKKWYKRFNPLRWGNIPNIPEKRTVSHEYKAGFFSQLTFQWMTSLMTTGYKRGLEQNDIWMVNPDRAVEPLTSRVDEIFQKHVRNGQKHPLFWALHHIFRFEFWLSGFCAVLGVTLRVVSAFALRFLIQFAVDAYNANKPNSVEPMPSIRRGIGLAIGITAMMVVQGFSIVHFIYRGEMIGGQVKGVLVKMIYNKAMVISHQARIGHPRMSTSQVEDDLVAERKEPEDDQTKDRDSEASSKKKNESRPANGTGWANGRIINLMSVDTHRINKASAYFHMTWTSPIQILLVFFLLFINISYYALPGFGLLVVGIPMLSMVIHRLGIRRQETNSLTEQRISLTQEFLHFIRTVKYFGWEDTILGRLSELRSKEIRSIRTLLAIGSSLDAVSILLPILASMLSFIAYSLARLNLTPANAFSALTLFNSLRLPLKLFPVVLGQVIDAWSSMKHIEQFLLQQEHKDYLIRKSDGKTAFDIKEASFTWEAYPTKDSDMSTPAGPDESRKPSVACKDDEALHKDNSSSSIPLRRQKRFSLKDISLDIKHGELIAVIGVVGSGKSSLLTAMAGEMHKTSGDVVAGSSISFCPQCPWIQTTTVRNNITFGAEMEERRYKEVIKACALETDLDMLPEGDQTEVGERGLTISGGQKQRLSLARAIYFDADIILLDDPLSAVDAHVGRHIFQNAIIDLLHNKCRILVTHQLWVLNRCDRIIWMDAGEIRAVDTFENFMRNNIEFQRLIETTTIEENQLEARKMSPSSPMSDGEWSQGTKGRMQSEEEAESVVLWSHYGAYIRATGSVLRAVLLIPLLLLAQGAIIMTSLWLSFWTSDKFSLSKEQYILIYIGIGALQTVFVLAFSLLLSILGAHASKVMLYDAFARVLRTPVSFFDTTPLGRIISRFTHDIYIIDNELTTSICTYLFTLAMVFSVFAFIIAFFPYFAIALFFLTALFIPPVLYYRASASEINRLKSIWQSQMFAKFNEGLGGIESIRAYRMKQRFIDDLSRSIDKSNSAYFLAFSSEHWISTRLNMVGNALIFTVSMLVVTSSFSVDPSFGGLVLSYILTMVQMLQQTSQQLAEVEDGMGSVKRIHCYGTELKMEAPSHTIEVRQTWPEKGEIIFNDVHMRYRENLPLVLKGLSFHIQSGECIGIVGRTGAGKSSIMSTLFRLVEISSGKITIDGLDISTIGLHDLRSHLSIIPQDSSLFKGSIRSNLDPSNRHTDSELWSALRQAHLTSNSLSINQGTMGGDLSCNSLGLETIVEENGQNFSLGQRQLMAFARALVRGSQIVLCNEASSSVDVETDKMIQRTMRTVFRGKTLLYIAHRLHTILGYDRICVIDQGRVAELDTPLELWRRGGAFRNMCDRSGIGINEIQVARAEMAAFEETKSG